MRATEQAKRLVEEALREGDVGVDATLGNGYDTLFLAERVGSAGRVIGFDVQEAAVISTRARLQDKGVLTRCELHHLGHEKMGEVIDDEVGAVMFNLGYLPGSEKTTITLADTTLLALRAGAELLRSGGVLTAVCYVGHEGGEEEASAVVTWAESLGAEFEIGVGERVASRPFLVSVRRISAS